MRGMGSRIRGDNGWGWVHASAGTTEGEWFPHPRGQRGGWVHASARTTGGGWVCTRIRPPSWGAGSPRGDGDGSTHPRGQRVGMGSTHPRGQRGGWVHASARTTGGDGSTHPRGQRVKRGQGGGWVHASARTTGGDGSAPPSTFPPQGGREGDGSPHPRGQRVGMGPRIREGQRGGWGYWRPRRSRAGITWARLVTVAWGSSSVGGW